MLNQIKSTFTVTTPPFRGKSVGGSLSPGRISNDFTPSSYKTLPWVYRFQNADPKTQRVIVMAMLAWLDQHSLQSYGHQDQNAWQMGWKMREAFLHMLQFKIPFRKKM